MNKIIRKLTPLDSIAVCGHFQRLDRETRLLRFCGPVSDTFIDEYARATPSLHRRALGYVVDGEIRAVGELAMSGWPLDSLGEIALSVEPAHQSQGIGAALVERLLTMATNRGVRRVRVSSLWHNARMRHLIRKFNFRPLRGNIVIDAEITLGWPTYWSMLDEGFSDWRSMTAGAREALAA